MALTPAPLPRAGEGQARKHGCWGEAFAEGCMRRGEDSLANASPLRYSYGIGRWIR